MTIAGHTMHWHVLVSDQQADGGVVLSGMTDGSKPLWNDQFWFELRFNDVPPLIRYWGDQVIWREDRAA